jgi:hypothetical protein
MLPRTPRPAAASTVASDAARGMLALAGASSSVAIRPGDSRSRPIASSAVPEVTTNGLPDPSSAPAIASTARWSVSAASSRLVDQSWLKAVWTRMLNS